MTSVWLIQTASGNTRPTLRLSRTLGLFIFKGESVEVGETEVWFLLDECQFSGRSFAYLMNLRRDDLKMIFT